MPELSGVSVGGIGIAENKHRWLCETAAAFGMNITTFSKCMGYSRQMIYQASCGISHMEKGRLAVAMYKLQDINNIIYEEEKRVAKERFEHRNMLIDKLEDRLSG
jgi:hypothetical protein